MNYSSSFLIRPSTRSWSVGSSDPGPAGFSLSPTQPGVVSGLRTSLSGGTDSGRPGSRPGGDSGTRLVSRSVSGRWSRERSGGSPGSGPIDLSPAGSRLTCLGLSLSGPVGSLRPSPGSTTGMT